LAIGIDMETKGQREEKTLLQRSKEMDKINNLLTPDKKNHKTPREPKRESGECHFS